MPITEQQVQLALREIIDASTGKDYVSTNEARNIRIDGPDVSLDIVLGYPAKSVIEGIRKQVADKLGAIPGIGGVVMIEADLKTVKVGLVFEPHTINQLLGRNAFLFGAKHHRRAVRVIRTDVVDLMLLHFLESHPDIGLDIFHQMSQMDAAIGVGQCGGNENFSLFHQSAIKFAKSNCNKL